MIVQNQMPLTPFAVLFCLVFLATAQPLRPIHTLTKRATPSLGTGATVAILLVVFATVVMTLVCCCAMINRQPAAPEPTPLELANDVGMLRARIEELEAERAGGTPADRALAAPPPTYTM
ncbi:hypothetical protein B0H17DRAFT_1077732 [Mycena rosella]|uniref:Transmembrane protein n=1 Tax=Mycena rosella TaxID=1033263 RepID=A0AAD7D505_MYCRO|nr:hypothetical protein B0H17DRAFT_1077732 [Mycena rosella]